MLLGYSHNFKKNYWDGVVDNKYLKKIAEIINENDDYYNLLVEFSTSVVMRLYNFPNVSFIYLNPKNLISVKSFFEFLLENKTFETLSSLNKTSGLLSEINDCPLFCSVGNVFNYLKYKRILYFPFKRNNINKYAFSGVVISKDNYDVFIKKIKSKNILSYFLDKFIPYYDANLECLDLYKNQYNFIGSFATNVFNEREKIIIDTYPFDVNVHSQVDVELYKIKAITVCLLKNFFARYGFVIKDRFPFINPENIKEKQSLYIELLREFITSDHKRKFFYLHNNKIKCEISFFKKFYLFLQEKGIDKDNYKHIVADLIRYNLLTVCERNKNFNINNYLKTVRFKNKRTCGMSMPKNIILP